MVHSGDLSLPLRGHLLLELQDMDVEALRVPNEAEDWRPKLDVGMLTVWPAIRT